MIMINNALKMKYSSKLHNNVLEATRIKGFDIKLPNVEIFKNCLLSYLVWRNWRGTRKFEGVRLSSL